jgi:hypothetical protein
MSGNLLTFVTWLGYAKRRLDSGVFVLFGNYTCFTCNYLMINCQSVVLQAQGGFACIFYRCCEKK